MTVAVKVLSNCVKFKSSRTQSHSKTLHYTYQAGEELEPLATAGDVKWCGHRGTLGPSGTQHRAGLHGLKRAHCPETSMQAGERAVPVVTRPEGQLCTMQVSPEPLAGTRVAPEARPRFPVCTDFPRAVEV